jgi:hypothetical protein
MPLKSIENQEWNSIAAFKGHIVRILQPGRSRAAGDPHRRPPEASVRRDLQFME